jgi:hypothetical protein
LKAVVLITMLVPLLLRPVHAGVLAWCA